MAALEFIVPWGTKKQNLQTMLADDDSDTDSDDAVGIWSDLVDSALREYPNKVDCPRIKTKEDGTAVVLGSGSFGFVFETEDETKVVKVTPCSSNLGINLEKKFRKENRTLAYHSGQVKYAIMIGKARLGPKIFDSFSVQILNSFSVQREGCFTSFLYIVMERLTTIIDEKKTAVKEKEILQRVATLTECRVSDAEWGYTIKGHFDRMNELDRLRVFDLVYTANDSRRDKGFMVREEG